MTSTEKTLRAYQPLRARAIEVGIVLGVAWFVALLGAYLLR